MSLPILSLENGIHLDGQVIRGVKSIKIESSTDIVSEVQLVIACRVAGLDHTESIDAYKVTTGTIPAEAITQSEQLDWEAMKERMLEQTLLIEEKRRNSERSFDKEILSELKEVKENIKNFIENVEEMIDTKDSISLEVDGLKIGELTTKALNRYHRQQGNIDLQL